MRIERERFLGAGHYERTPERHGYANGTRPKKIDTPAGTVTLEVPKTAGHDEPFYPSALERGRRSCRAVMLAVAEMYIKGVSTRDAEAVMSKFGLESLSSSQVSRAAKLLDEELEAWRNRPLGEIRYLLLDARYEKVREAGVVRDAAVLSAIGIGPDQRRRVLGVSARTCAISEAEVHWRVFLESLVARGMRGVAYIVSDDHPGLGAARKAVLGGASWQRCQFHLAQNAIHHAPNLAIRKRNRKGAAPGLGRRRPQGRRGRAGAPGGKLPRQGRQTRPLARGRDPRRPHRLLVARAPPQAHANLEPHRAIHPAGDQAPNRQGQGLPKRGLPRTARHRHPTSRSTRNGPQPGGKILHRLAQRESMRRDCGRQRNLEAGRTTTWLNAIEIAQKTGALLIATAELVAWMGSQGLPRKQGYAMMQSGVYRRDGISVKMVQAVHTAGIRIPDQAARGYGGESVGYIITFENGLRLYFSGDTGLFGDMKLFGELFKPHVAILSTWGRFMMEPEDGALATKFLMTDNPNLKTIIPAHHGIKRQVPGATGTPEKVAAEVKKLGLSVTVLDAVPGKTYTLTK